MLRDSLRICIHDLTEQVRFPRSKKQRIIKKWAKRPENHQPSTQCYVTPDGTIVCSAPIAYRLRKENANGAVTSEMVRRAMDME
jgi:hypothetical protein